MAINFENYKPPIDELISLRQAADISGLSQPHLRLLVRDQKIWALKIDSMWLTTKDAVYIYMKQDRKTGPKPKTA